jgi:hypothetical protein
MPGFLAWLGKNIYLWLLLLHAREVPIIDL